MNNLKDFPTPFREFSSNEYNEFLHSLSLITDNASGPYPENRMPYMGINYRRSSRVLKTFQVDALQTEQFLNAPRLIWYLITEPWCGDAAHSVPVIMKLAESIEEIQLNIILRDENPLWMERFLTNGSKSIPVLAVFEERSGNLLGHWGPRPGKLQSLFLSLKQENKNKEEIQEILQKWYNADKGKSIENEVISFILEALKNQVSV